MYLYQLPYSDYVTESSKIADSMDPIYSDSPLSIDGIQQCKLNMDWFTRPHIVYMSPMKRSIMTAYLLFKDHPRFTHIKFIVDPDLRPRLERACDIPLRLQDTINEFNHLFNHALDYSLVEKMGHDLKDWADLWFTQNMDPEFKGFIQKHVQKNTVPGMLEYPNYVVQMMKEKATIESTSNCKRRLRAFADKSKLAVETLNGK